MEVATSGGSGDDSWTTTAEAAGRRTQGRRSKPARWPGPAPKRLAARPSRDDGPRDGSIRRRTGSNMSWEWPNARHGRLNAGATAAWSGRLLDGWNPCSKAATCNGAKWRLTTEDRRRFAAASAQASQNGGRGGRLMARSPVGGERKTGPTHCLHRPRVDGGVLKPVEAARTLGEARHSGSTATAHP